MITICKLTISTFRLGIPNVSKFSFTVLVDRNAVIKLHKSEKVMLNCKTAGYEPFNGVEDREEVPEDRKHPWSTRVRKKTECPLSSTLQKHEGKAATKPSSML